MRESASETRAAFCVLARFSILKMVASYALEWIFASVLGLVALYNLVAKKNRSSVASEARRESVKNVTTTTSCECRSTSGDVDVIIVGAGVAGSALALTLAKVITIVFTYQIFFSRFDFFLASCSFSTTKQSI